MLSPRFTAKEALAVSTMAEEWLNKVDEQITISVLTGQLHAYVLIYDRNASSGLGEHTEIGMVFIKARDFFISHYARRGFTVTEEGPYLKIKWS